MIQKKILWGEPERSLCDAQRLLLVQQCLKAKAQVRAGATADPTALAADLLLDDLVAIKAVADA